MLEPCDRSIFDSACTQYTNHAVSVCVSVIEYDPVIASTVGGRSGAATRHVYTDHRK